MNKALVALVLAGLLFAAYAIAQEGSEQPPAETPPAEQPPEEMPPAEQPPEEIPPQEMPPMPPENVFGDVQVPEGCAVAETGTGFAQMECGFEKQDFQEFDVSDEMQECGGKFEIIAGAPVCTEKGSAGFMGTTCPSEQEIAEAKSNCSGKTEEMLDASGCQAVRCVHEQFKQEYDQRIEEKYGGSIKAEALKCQRDMGKLSIVKGEPVCIAVESETILTEKEMQPITEQDLENASNKMEKLGQAIEKIAAKLEPLKEGFEEEGKTQEAETFSFGLQKLEGVKEKIEEIKAGLSDASTLSEDERRAILVDLQEIRKTVSDITTGVIQGKIPTEEEMQEFVFKQFDEFYGSPFGSKEDFEKWVEKEKEATDIIKGCAGYSAEKPYSFVPPDPEAMVVLVDIFGLVEGKCKIRLHSKDGSIAEYLLPAETYTNWTGPELLSGLDCSGECGFMQNIFQLIESGKGGSAEEVCMNQCIRKDCALGMFACMQQNREACELECGLRKEGEGPFVDGQLDPMQACVMMCIQGSGIERCGPGGTNPVCLQCEQQCISAYGPGIKYERCISGEQVEAKQAECAAQGKYGEPLEEFVADKTCITDIVCKEYEQVGDNPGTGPGIGEPGYNPPTGQAILGTVQDAFSKFFEWIGGWFK